MKGSIHVVLRNELGTLTHTVHQEVDDVDGVRKHLDAANLMVLEHGPDGQVINKDVTDKVKPQAPEGVVALDASDASGHVEPDATPIA